MHLPNDFLDPKFSGGLLGAALGALAYCLSRVIRAVTAVVPKHVLAGVGGAFGNMQAAGRRVLTKLGEEKVREMAIVAAWVFSAQMFNFPVGAGTSGHLMGGVFAAVILGPFAGTVVISVVLLVQAFFFADGGLMALGANIINMAVLGSFASYHIYAGLKRTLPELVSIAVAAWFSVMLAALACSLEIGFSGTAQVAAVTSAMLKAHSIIGLAEAGITVLLVRYFDKRKEA